MVRSVLLVENALTPHDVQRIAALHGSEPLTVHLVVPVDTRHNRLIEAIDDLALGRLREAVTDTGDPPPERAQATARATLEAATTALRQAGVTVEGELVPDDPVESVVALARRVDADEVLVVTEPHLLEETFHRDWASRIRDELALPVLHTVAGTDRVVS
jgi:hypothetical protein